MLIHYINIRELWLRAFKRTHAFLSSHNIYKLSFFSICLITISGILVSKYEGFTIDDGIWWSIVTATTVGYGDISPKTVEGRIIAVVLMLSGISVICALTGKIAEVMLLSKIRGFKGLTTKKFKDHVIICNWNGHSLKIIKEIKLKDPNKKIVVIDSRLDPSLLNEENVYFQKGIVNEENLVKAGIHNAETVIILGDSCLEHKDRDAKCVLDMLTVEHLSPNIYSIVEIIDEKNEEYCYKASADEVISSYSIGSYLLSSSAIHHGMSKVVGRLLSERHDQQFGIIECPNEYFDMQFGDVLIDLKTKHNKILVGTMDCKHKDLNLNPDASKVIKRGAKLIVIE